MKVKMRQKGHTYYSKPLPKGRGNYDAYTVDVYEGYVGITSIASPGSGVVQRVLLSPAQFAAVIEFAARKTE